MWRLRTRIQSEVIIEPGELEEAPVIFRVFEFNDQNAVNGSSTPSNLRYCDVFWNDEKDIFEAFAHLENGLNKFLDRISLVSYGKSARHSILSIAPESVKPDEKFDIAFPQWSTNRKTINIRLPDLKYSSEITSEQQRWERLLRLGLNAISGEEKYINYYSLLEEIARYESTEFIVNKCRNCKHEETTGRKATNNYIKNLLNKYDIDEDLINKASSIRNKIAHGGAEKNKTFYADVAKLNSHLEEVCLLELEERLNIYIRNRLNAHIVDIPMVKHTCVCNLDNSFDLINTTQTIPARFVKLKHSLNSAFEDQEAYIGMPLDCQQKPFIDPFSWPDIEPVSLTQYSKIIVK